MEILKPLDYESEEYQRRKTRQLELEERLSIGLPPPTFTIRSILEWMALPIENPLTEQQSWSFFRPLYGDEERFDTYVSTCVYKHVAARLIVLHANLYHTETLEQAMRSALRKAGIADWHTAYYEGYSQPTETHGISGLRFGHYDKDKFTDQVREGWIQEAASLALSDLEKKAADPRSVEELSDELRTLLKDGIVSPCDNPEDILGVSVQRSSDPEIGTRVPVELSCASITNAVRKATGLADFKYCPIGKVGGAPKRDRWEHCPSVCAERSALIQWKEVSAQRLIRDPHWLDTVQKTMLTTAVPCYFCAMGLAHEAALDTVIIGGLVQRPNPPWLNTDDEFALDILAQTIGTRGGMVRFYYKKEVIEYIKQLDSAVS